MDLRGHGKSYTDDDLDLSIEVVVGEIVALLSDKSARFLSGHCEVVFMFFHMN